MAKLQQAQISSNLMNLQIQTPDPKILWMVASAGAIEKSEDGGTTWKPEYLETRAPIVAGSAPTRENLLAGWRERDHSAHDQWNALEDD